MICAAESVLSFGAFGILEDLPHRRLPHVQVCAALQVTGGDLLVLTRRSTKAIS